MSEFTNVETGIKRSLGGLAIHYAQTMKAQHAEYYADRAVNGRSDYCVHGTYVGTWWGPDYMCGACESGNFSIYAEALAAAKRDYAEMQRRMDLYVKAHEINLATIPGNQFEEWRDRAIAFCFEPMETATKHTRPNLKDC